MLVYVFAILLVLTSFALVSAVLVQRGRSAGLSVLVGRIADRVVGVKSGDVVTRITIGLAVTWTVVAWLTGVLMR